MKMLLIIGILPKQNEQKKEIKIKNFIRLI